MANDGRSISTENEKISMKLDATHHPWLVLVNNEAHSICSNVALALSIAELHMKYDTVEIQNAITKKSFYPKDFSTLHDMILK